VFSAVTRCVVFVGRPRHSQQFDVVPISPGHDAKATDHQEGHDVHATPFQLNLESCEHFFTVQKKNDIQFQTKPTSRTLQCNGYCKRYYIRKILKSSEMV